MKANKKDRVEEAMSIDDIIKMTQDIAAKDEERRRAEAEAKNNLPKIVSIWVKKLNINKSNPMKDSADIQLTWSDGKVEDTTFGIGTSGETLGTKKWDDPNDTFKDDDELAYQREVRDGGYKVKDGYLQMDKFYRDIVKSLRQSVKVGREFVSSYYPERRDINGSLSPSHKGARHETRLDRAIPVYKGGETVKNPYQDAGVQINDEDVRVCMIRFGFQSQPDIKWYYGKDKYEDPVWAFSRVKPDPSVQKVAKQRVQKSYEEASSSSRGVPVFKSGNTTIYKLF